MIAICIPVYNFDVRPLVADLINQMEALNAQTELILIDDASEEHYQSINQFSHPLVRQFTLSENIGRAAIRNRFLTYTQQPFLLFLDCDSNIVRENFLRTYLQVTQSSDYKVFTGGRIYPSTCAGAAQKLSWKYGSLRESKSLKERQQQPYLSFMTNNFLIHREIWSVVQFDESLRQYGHEDTLFGFHLKQAGIEIQHLDNPILNGHLETNREFLSKTEKGIKNLVHLVNTYGSDTFGTYVKLSQMANRWPFGRWSVPFTHPLKRLIYMVLKNGWVNLRLFDFYKLLIYLQHRYEYPDLSQR